jgi:hypothetical protein
MRNLLSYLAEDDNGVPALKSNNQRTKKAYFGVYADEHSNDFIPLNNTTAIIPTLLQEHQPPIFPEYQPPTGVV